MNSECSISLVNVLYVHFCVCVCGCVFIHVHTVPFLLVAGLVCVVSVGDTVACTSVVTAMVVELICPNGNITYFNKNKHIFAYRF